MNIQSVRRKLKSLPIEIRAFAVVYIYTCRVVSGCVCGGKKRRSEDGRFILNSVFDNKTKIFIKKSPKDFIN